MPSKTGNVSAGTRNQPVPAGLPAAARRRHRRRRRRSPASADLPGRPCSHLPCVQEEYDLDQKIDTGKLIDSAGAGRSMFSPGWLTQLNQLWGGKSVGALGRESLGPAAWAMGAEPSADDSVCIAAAVPCMQTMWLLVDVACVCCQLLLLCLLPAAAMCCQRVRHRPPACTRLLCIACFNCRTCLRLVLSRRTSMLCRISCRAAAQLLVKTLPTCVLNCRTCLWPTPSLRTSRTCCAGRRNALTLHSLSALSVQNVPVANAKPEDIQDLLGGALFKALYKWMLESGPVYLLPTGRIGCLEN